MATWWNLVPGCFGGGNARFQTVETAFDRQGAFALLSELRRQGVPWEEVREYFDWYLHDTRVVPESIPQHLKNLEAVFRPWLT